MINAVTYQLIIINEGVCCQRGGVERKIWRQTGRKQQSHHWLPSSSLLPWPKAQLDRNAGVIPSAHSSVHRAELLQHNVSRSETGSPSMEVQKPQVHLQGMKMPSSLWTGKENGVIQQVKVTRKMRSITDFGNKQKIILQYDQRLRNVL